MAIFLYSPSMKFYFIQNLSGSVNTVTDTVNLFIYIFIYLMFFVCDSMEIRGYIKASLPLVRVSAHMVYGSAPVLASLVSLCFYRLFTTSGIYLDSNISVCVCYSCQPLSLLSVINVPYIM